MDEEDKVDEDISRYESESETESQHDTKVTNTNEIVKSVNVKQDDDDCTCEATKFLAKYKDRIAKYFDKLLMAVDDADIRKSKQFEEEDYVPRIRLESLEQAGEDMEVPERFYIQALDAKIQRLFSESMITGEEEHSEKGYYLFGRFVGYRSSSGSYAYSYSTTTQERSAKLEGEEEYQAEVEPGEWMSESMRAALDYLNNRNIEDLFKFLGSHLVTSNPCNPIGFLIELLEQCIIFRAGHGEPPLLFRQEHVESLFDSMDPMKTGFIDVNQYHNAMFTFRLKDYNMFPKLAKSNLVAKHVFIHEALQALRIQLLSLLQTGLPGSTVSAVSTKTVTGR